MALGNGCGSKLRRTNSEYVSREGLRFGNYMRTIGRKRIVVTQCLEDVGLSSSPTTPPRKRSSIKAISERSYLEALPQDILVQILCRVDHEDLNQLFHVSKSVKEAALLAEKMHFAFSTPSSKTSRLKSVNEDIDKFEEAPNAPIQRRWRPRFSDGRLAGISVALFAFPEEQRERTRG